MTTTETNKLIAEFINDYNNHKDEVLNM